MWEQREQREQKKQKEIKKGGERMNTYLAEHLKTKPEPNASFTENYMLKVQNKILKTYLCRLAQTVISGEWATAQDIAHKSLEILQEEVSHV